MNPKPPDPFSTSRRKFFQTVAAGLGGEVFLRSVAEGQAAGQPFVTPSGPPRSYPVTEADLGNLYTLIEKQATRRYFPLAYTRPQYRDIQRWKRIARTKLLDLLHYTPPRWVPQARTVHRQDMGDYLRETVTFQTTPNIRVPAEVLVPKDAKRRETPAIIALHDHSGFYLWGRERLFEAPDQHDVLHQLRQRYYGGKAIATELVKQGYLVVAIDMFYFGERRLILDNDPAEWRQRPKNLTLERISAYNIRSSEYEALTSRTIFAAGFTWPGVVFWDDIRTVDYLISRPEVDRNRIGCIGFSIGGLRAGFLAALDDRVKAAVIASWMTSLPYQLKDHIKYTIGFSKLVPGLHRYLDYPDVVALAMPSPLLVMTCGQDGLFNPDGVAASLQKLRASYQKANLGDRLVIQEFDAPHVFNEDMQTVAWDFLKKAV